MALLKSPLYLCLLSFRKLIITVESVKVQGFVIRSETFDNISDDTTSGATPRGMLENSQGVGGELSNTRPKEEAIDKLEPL